MGLDASIRRAKRTDGLPAFHTPVDFKVNPGAEDGEESPAVTDEEVAYFRKHHDLHGWMENLYRAKGGQADSFNCVPVMLTEADLNLLERETRENALPPTSGFFFGSGNTDHYKQATLEAIAAARQSLAEGWQVYYDSWW